MKKYHLQLGDGKALCGARRKETPTDCPWCNPTTFFALKQDDQCKNCARQFNATIVLNRTADDYERYRVCLLDGRLIGKLQDRTFERVFPNLKITNHRKVVIKVRRTGNLYMLEKQRG